MKFSLFKKTENINYFIVTALSIGLFLAYLYFFSSTVISIYGKNSEPNLLQIYYSDVGDYSEKKSVSGVFGGSKDRISLELPGRYRYLRIDPSTHPGEVNILKIEVKNLFLNDVYSGEKLANHIRPLMMIGELETSAKGLKISSTGIDPAFLFESQDINYIFLPQLTLIGLILFILSLTIFKLIKLKDNYSYLRRFHDSLSTFSIVLLVSFFLTATITLISYPGFMSYDSLHGLRGARGSVTDAIWPPMVSYVWRFVDLISLDTYAMLFLQVYILICSIFFIIYRQSKNILWTIIPIIIYLLQPYILGTLLVIWKDVLTAAFLLASLALLNKLEDCLRHNEKYKTIVIFLVIIFCIFIGVSTRHNSIVAALPIIFYVAKIIVDNLGHSLSVLRSNLSTVFLFLFLFLSVYTPKVVIDHYSLPSLAKIESPNKAFFRNVHILDLAGASVCLNQNLFITIAPELSIDDIKKQYDPKHINLSADILSKFITSDEVDYLWAKMIISHPLCALYNKYHMTRYLLGINYGPQFLITHPFIDKNEYGIELHESKLRNKIINYINKSSEILIIKPWFILILSTILLFLYYFRISKNKYYITIYLSGLLYFIGVCLFGNASDARLLFYSNTTFILIIVLVLISFVQSNLSKINGEYFK